MTYTLKENKTQKNLLTIGLGVAALVGAGAVVGGDDASANFSVQQSQSNIANYKAGQKISLPKTANAYGTALEAQAKTNAKKTIPAGQYTIYKVHAATGAVNITTQPGKPGNWVHISEFSQATQTPSKATAPAQKSTPQTTQQAKTTTQQTQAVAKVNLVEGAKIKIDGKLNRYTSAIDAKNKKNSPGTYDQGEFYVVRVHQSTGQYNISKQAGKAGSWVNAEELARVLNKNVEQPKKAEPSKTTTQQSTKQSTPQATVPASKPATVAQNGQTQGTKIAHVLGGNYSIYQGFGQYRSGGYHDGVDIFAPGQRGGDPVFSPVSGTVIWAGTASDGGVGARIKTSNGDVITLWHFERGSLTVKTGTVVQAGQKVGKVGNTGNTGGTGARHVHFSVKNSKGQAVNPYKYIPGITNPNDLIIRGGSAPSVWIDPATNKVSKVANHNGVPAKGDYSRAKVYGDGKVTQTTQSAQSTTTTKTTTTQTTKKSAPRFDNRGLLVMQKSQKAQQVINLKSQAPGHKNGAAIFAKNGVNKVIDQLSTEEAIWVLYRLEGAGFGQTGDGYAGIDSAQSHKNFVKKQLDRRFGGSIHELLKKWGTYPYGGY